MLLDPQRLARVRAHLLAATAVVTAGCGANSTPDHTINEPAHINTAAPDPPPPAAPTTPPNASAAAPTPANTANEVAQVTAPPEKSAPAPTSKVVASPKQPDPVHINTPNPNAR